MCAMLLSDQGGRTHPPGRRPGQLHVVKGPKAPTRHAVENKIEDDCKQRGNQPEEGNGVEMAPRIPAQLCEVSWRALRQPRRRFAPLRRRQVAHRGGRPAAHAACRPLPKRQRLGHPADVRAKRGLLCERLRPRDYRGRRGRRAAGRRRGLAYPTVPPAGHRQADHGPHQGAHLVALRAVADTPPRKSGQPRTATDTSWAPPMCSRRA